MDRNEPNKQARWYARPAALVLWGLAFRYACLSVMILMTLVAERRPAPTLPDAILSWVPRINWIDRYNYQIWLLAYVPLAIVLGLRHMKPFLRFLVAGGILSILRGLSILATGLGPVHSPDLNANMSWHQVFVAWKDLVNPVSTLMGHGAQISLTKDLFFSGHTATTFLLLLYCWRDPALRWWALAAHTIVVAVVFLSHLHYTIDVIGAYAVTFSLYVLFEWWPLRRQRQAQT